jgi:hypothetical protein
MTSIKADDPDTRHTDIKTANEMHTIPYVGTVHTNSHNVPGYITRTL